MVMKTVSSVFTNLNPENSTLSALKLLNVFAYIGI